MYIVNMKFLFVFSTVVATHQLCYGATRFRSFGALDMRTQRLYSSKGLPDFADSADDEKREVFSYEQTIIVRDAGPDNEARNCEIIEVYKEDEAAEVSKELEFRLKLKLQEIDMRGIMALLANCDSIDDSGKNEELDKEPKEKLNSPNALINGIFPGTKWCGLGDIANNNYHDLGKFRNVDRCCRSHDLCPIKVFSKDTRYKLTNKSMYTKSHCICDKAFYDCLKKDNGWTAKFIGNLYFYAASPQCVKGVPENSGEILEFISAPNKW